MCVCENFDIQYIPSSDPNQGALYLSRLPIFSSCDLSRFFFNAVSVAGVARRDSPAAKLEITPSTSHALTATMTVVRPGQSRVELHKLRGCPKRPAEMTRKGIYVCSRAIMYIHIFSGPFRRRSSEHRHTIQYICMCDYAFYVLDFQYILRL